MSVSIKSEHEIELMRHAGHLLEKVHNELAAHIRPGISTKELDRIGEEMIRSLGCTPNFLNYNGFPGSFCISINDEVVHGIPSKKKIIQEGDLVKIDAGLIYQGYHSDAARTYAVGEVSPEARQLMEVTKQSFFEGIKFAREGYRVSDIGAAVQAYVEANGFSVVRDYVGHGVGAALHESPEVPNYGKPGHGIRLQRGMVIAVEPMVNVGVYTVKVLPDGWTVKTRDGKLSAHYENTIAITDGEPEILTNIDGEVL